MAGRFVLPLSNLFDASGNKLANGTLEFYQTATSTPLDTYSDFARTVVNDNPVNLDANGLPDVEIFLLAQAYKVVVKSSAGTILKTYDPVWPAPGLNDSNTFTKTQIRAKGADTASATTVVVGTDGDIFDMTGTTTVTAFTIAKGREVTYQFDGAVTLTHHATNLILPGAANITTAAGDILKLTAYDTDKVYGTFHRAASVKQIAQIVSDIPGTGGTGTTQIPFDDTIPQNTEGDQYLSVAITPKNASSTLIIDVAAMASHSFVGVTVITAALFQDSTAGALRASGEHNGTTDSTTNVSFRHIMTAGTTSATTFKVRVGGNQAGTTTFNGNAGAQRLGTVAASGLVITEILP